jgi:hypothetical protein
MSPHRNPSANAGRIAAAALCAGILAAIAACSASAPAGSLSDAFCSDLQSGLTPMNILGSSVKDGTYTPQQAADLAYGFTANSCPEQLQSNAGLRTYLANWGINPDA